MVSERPGGVEEGYVVEEWGLCKAPCREQRQDAWCKRRWARRSRHSTLAWRYSDATRHAPQYSMACLVGGRGDVHGEGTGAQRIWPVQMLRHSVVP